MKFKLYKELSNVDYEWLEYIYETLGERAERWKKKPKYRKQIETELGADLFYSSSTVLFRGGISEEAKRLMNENGGRIKTKKARLIVNDHEYNRRKTARIILQMYIDGKNITWKRFLILCVRKYLVMNTISKYEHGILTQLQEIHEDLTPKEQYKMANIELIKT